MVTRREVVTMIVRESSVKRELTRVVPCPKLPGKPVLILFHPRASDRQPAKVLCSHFFQSHAAMHHHTQHYDTLLSKSKFSISFRFFNILNLHTTLHLIVNDLALQVNFVCEKDFLWCIFIIIIIIIIIITTGTGNSKVTFLDCRV
jgi:hypothetical protein